MEEMDQPHGKAILGEKNLGQNKEVIFFVGQERKMIKIQG